MKVDDRWEIIKTIKACLTCLNVGHRSRECPDASKCPKDGCERWHHQLLHSGGPARKARATNQIVQVDEAENAEPVVPDDQVPPGAANAAVIKGLDGPLQIIPVKLKKNNKAGFVSTYALLDSGATRSLMLKSLAEELGTEGAKQDYCYAGINGQQVTVRDSMQVDCEAAGTFRGAKYQTVINCVTIDNIYLRPYSFNMEEAKRNWPHLKNVNGSTLKEVVPSIVIGNNNPELLIPNRVVRGAPGTPVALRTQLGWTVCGNFDVVPGHGMINVTSCEEEATDDYLHDIIKLTFTTENFGVKAIKTLGKLQPELRIPSPHLYSSRPWTAASSASATGDGDGDRETPTKGRSSIFPQPSYTTSFLLKSGSSTLGNEGRMGYQKRLFQESPNSRPGPMSTSTPMAREAGGGSGTKPRGDSTFSYATQVRPSQQSEPMITHPGTLHSQAYSPGDASQKLEKTGVLLRSLSSSQSEDNSFHSSSSSDYEENKVPETADLEELTTGIWQGSSKIKGKGKENSFKGAISSTTPQVAGVTPKIVQTTTNQTVVKDKKGIRQDDHEREEDSTPGGGGIVSLSSTINKAEAKEHSVDSIPRIQAPQVKTRMDTSVEKEKNATTSQIEEKTFTHTTSTFAKRTEQTVVTQEVRATATTLTSDQGQPAMDSSVGKPPIVKTESVKYDPSTYSPGMQAQPTTHVPVVQTETLKVAVQSDDGSYVASGEIVSSQMISSKVRTEETVTYKTEKHGVVETRVEQKIMIQSDGDPIHHDKALSEATQEAVVLGIRMAATLKEELRVQISSRWFWSDSRTVLCWIRYKEARYKEFVANKIGEIQEDSKASERHWVPTKLKVADQATRFESAVSFYPTSELYTGPAFLKLETSEFPREREDVGVISNVCGNLGDDTEADEFWTRWSREFLPKLLHEKSGWRKWNLSRLEILFSSLMISFPGTAGYVAISHQFFLDLMDKCEEYALLRRISRTRKSCTRGQLLRSVLSDFEWKFRSPKDPKFGAGNFSESQPTPSSLPLSSIMRWCSRGEECCCREHV